MSLELNPVGTKCNLSCPYCYENPMRAAGNFSPGYDLEAMKRGLEAEGGEWTLFGGEPLLTPLPDLEALLQWGYAQHGKTGVQTNGALITAAHVALFVRYHTHVSFSLDGPDELNDSRWAGTLEKTRQATVASVAAFDACLAAGLAPSLIVTLYRGNASAARLPRLLEWIRTLDRQGVQSMRIHLLEVDDPKVRTEMALTDDENVAALRALMALQDRLQRIRFDLFRDMTKLLLDGPYADTCIWNGCDPLTTPAVRAVNGLGGRANCSRTNKDGVDWVKTDRGGQERYLVLHSTPQTDGGCQDCRFFYACKGQCPGTAIAGDWRNRSEHCQVWFRTFEVLERQLVAIGQMPASLDTTRRGALERRLLTDWEDGKNGNSDHQDHWDAPLGYDHADAGVTVHGDLVDGVVTTIMHGDVGHGDHYDGA